MKKSIKTFTETWKRSCEKNEDWYVFIKAWQKKAVRRKTELSNDCDRGNESEYRETLAASWKKKCNDTEKEKLIRIWIWVVRGFVVSETQKILTEEVKIDARYSCQALWKKIINKNKKMQRSRILKRYDYNPVKSEECCTIIMLTRFALYPSLYIQLSKDMPRQTYLDFSILYLTQESSPLKYTQDELLSCFLSITHSQNLKTLWIRRISISVLHLSKQRRNISI